MAKYNIENYLEKDGLGFPLNFRRGNPNPLDNSAVWSSLEAAKNYAATDPVAYVGQILTVVEPITIEVEVEGEDGSKTTETRESTKVTAYSIQNEAGDLKEVGSVPVGDGLTIEVVDGKIQIKGAADAEAGAQPRMKDDGSIEWVVPSTDTVDGLQSTVAGLQSDVATLQSDSTTLKSDVATLKTDVDAVEAVVGKAATDTEGATGLVKGVADNATAIAAVNTKIGEVTEGKTVVEMISDATYDDTTLSERVATIEDDYLKAADKTTIETAIATAKSEVIGTAEDVSSADTVKGAKKYTDEKISALLDGASDETLDSIRELAAAIKENDSAIEALNGIAGSKAAQSDLEAAVERIGTLETDMTGKASASDLSDLQSVVSELDTAYKAADTAINEAIAKKADKSELETLSQLVGGHTTSISEIEEAVGKKAEQTALDDLTAIVNEKAAASDLTALTTRVGTNETDIAALKQADITINDAIAGKVDKQEGYRLISPDEATKLEKLVLGSDGSVSISGEISASNVKELNTWITTNRDSVDGLLSVADKTKLDGVEAGAQVNDIETITLGGSETALPISNKNVNIPVATAEVLGVVMGSAAENKIAVGTDGTMEVNSVNVNKLVQTTGETLILNGGSSAI